MTAIDKIRAIANWADDMSEDFNLRVASANDWLVLYDLAKWHEREFIDDESLYGAIDGNDEKFMREANAALGYKLYEV